MVSLALKIVTATVSTIGVAIMIWQMVNMLHKSTPSSGSGSSSGDSSSGDSSGGDSSGGKPTGDQFGGCSQSYTAVAGDTCTLIAENFNISVDQFLSLNLIVSSDCTKLHIGSAYCVESSGTDSSGGEGSSGDESCGDDSCSATYTAVAGDTCTSIAQNFGISVDQFLSLNPRVSPDCTNLHIGTTYCV